MDSCTSATWRARLLWRHYQAILQAKASTDVAVLRAALDATRRHLEGMGAKAAKCAAMMTPLPVDAGPSTVPDHKH